MADQNWVRRNCSNICCDRGCEVVATPCCAGARCVRGACTHLTSCLFSYLLSKLFEWFLCVVLFGVVIWYVTANLIHPYDYTIIEKRLRGSWA